MAQVLTVLAIVCEFFIDDVLPEWEAFSAFQSYSTRLVFEEIHFNTDSSNTRSQEISSSNI